MHDILLKNRLSSPVVTGTPNISRAGVPAAQTAAGLSFKEVLVRAEQEESFTVSKHATERILERGIQMTDESFTRLGEGIRLAKQKGAGEALVIVDSSAFIVSTGNSVVITALGGDELKGKVVTNITSTVIV